jgi:hypothetical protein
MVPASSRASTGSRWCSARKNSTATWVRIRARSCDGHRVVARVPQGGGVVLDALGDLDRNALTSASYTLYGNPRRVTAR